MNKPKKNYAIIASGSKQYRVHEGDVIEVELLAQEIGAQVEFQPIFVSADGKSLLDAKSLGNCVVKGELLEESFGPKVESVKYKPSHNEYRHFGHRQRYHKVKVTAIQAN